MRKKFPALCLALLLAATLCGKGLAAGTEFIVRAPETPVSAGEEFTVTVELAGNPGFASVQCTLSYDRSAMECAAISSGSVLEGALFSPNPHDSAGAVIAAIFATDTAGDGVLASYTFRALRDLSAFDFTLGEILLRTSENAPVPYTVTGAEEAPETPDSGQTVKTPDSGPSAGPGDAGTPDEALPHLFPDTAENWALESINQAVERGLFGGYQDGTFRPESRLSRAAFMKVLWNLAGQPEPSPESAPFTDIANWEEDLRKAITWAFQKGYIDGTSPTTFSPGEPLTRQAAMKILFNYSGAVSGLEALFTGIYDNTYTDSGLIAPWGKAPMYWAVYHEFLRGTTASTLSPGGLVSRAQLAVIMVRYTDRYPAG